MKSSKKNNLKGFAKQKQKKTTIKRMIVKFNMEKNNGG